MVEAYGGDKLTNLTSFIINKKMTGPNSGQGRSQLLDDIVSNHFYILHDIEAGKSRSDNFFTSQFGGFQAASISDGEQAWNINYQTNTYGSAQNADPYVIAGGPMRMNDAFLAYELSRAADKAKHLGEVDYLNRPHEMIQFPFPSSPDLTLYVDSETHLISKMIRMNPQIGQLDYVFSNVTEHNGISYAKSINFFIAGQANLISIENDTQFNVTISDSEFELPKNMREEAERIDTSEMSSTLFTGSIYHVGQGGGFSPFVDTTEGVVAIGGYPALKDRFNRYRADSDNYKPLKFRVVTHHHQDHLGGINEAIELGATLISVDENVASIQSFVAKADDARFLNVDKRLTIGKGRDRVEIYDVATTHAAHFLLTYVPSQKPLFFADHMNSPYKNGIPVANPGTVSMLNAVKKLGIDVKKIAIVHGARIFTMKEMQASVDAYVPSRCLGDRPVCP